jgi:hypothetical protein
MLRSEVVTTHSDKLKVKKSSWINFPYTNIDDTIISRLHKFLPGSKLVGSDPLFLVIQTGVNLTNPALFIGLIQSHHFIV